MPRKIPPRPAPESPLSQRGAGGIPAGQQLRDYDPRLKPLARELRNHQTEAEQRLWFHLRRDQQGTRFYRQRPLGRYILDFFSPKARLVVELDGSQHMEESRKAGDAQRDTWLRAQGLHVLRFDDRQVLTETEAVVEVIHEAIQRLLRGAIPPDPPLGKGGEVETHPAPGGKSPPFPKGG